ncbi:hypothetical protein GCM10027612_37840 [Microbispora bryophytorum subsp. camponoti]
MLHPLVQRVAAARVAAYGEDVAHARVGEPADEVAQLADRVVDRGEVGDGGERRLVRQPLDDVHRAVPGRAAGAVGHGDERRPQRFQLADRPPQLALPLVGLRREELERERALARGQQFADRRDAIRKPRGQTESHTGKGTAIAVFAALAVLLCGHLSYEGELAYLDGICCWVTGSTPVSLSV